MVTKKKITKKTPTTTKKTTTSVESKAEELEKKLGSLDSKFGFVNKLLAQKWMKNLLGSKAMNDVNNTLKPNLSTIFTVVAVLAFVSAIMSFIAFFGILGLSSFGVSWGFIIIMSLLLLISTLISLLTGIGLLKKKKRLPFVVLFSFVFQIVLLIVSSLSRGYGSNNPWISFVIMIALLLLVLKNKSYFNK